MIHSAARGLAFCVAIWLVWVAHQISQSAVVLMSSQRMALAIGPALPRTSDSFRTNCSSAGVNYCRIPETGSGGGWLDTVCHIMALDLFPQSPFDSLSRRPSTTVRVLEGSTGFLFAVAVTCIHAAACWVLARRVPSLHGVAWGTAFGKQRVYASDFVLFISGLLVLLVCIMLVIPFAWFWVSAFCETVNLGKAALIYLPSALPSAVTSAVFGYFLVLTAVVRRVSRPSMDLCWRCGYQAREFTPCPECGQADPASDPRFYFTRWGARLARSRWRWAYRGGLLLVFLTLLFLPLIIGTIRVWAYRLL